MEVLQAYPDGKNAKNMSKSAHFGFPYLGPISGSIFPSWAAFKPVPVHSQASAQDSELSKYVIIQLLGTPSIFSSVNNMISRLALNLQTQTQ